MQTRSLFYIFLFAFFLILSGLEAESQSIRYVKEGMHGSGSSWADASGDLQAMMHAEGVTQVWVAGGVYKPRYRPDNMSDANPDDPENAFVLRKDVRVFGGFAGDEATLSERSLSQANQSILSGDIGIAGDASDNVFHVVIAAGDVGTAELDGFVITQGNARQEHIVTVNGREINQRSGAGMYISGSSPLIRNVAFVSNRSIGNGAGIYMLDASPTFVNAQVRGNYGPSGAGAMSLSSSPRFVNVLFSGNQSFFSEGGGLAAEESTLSFVNCTFAGNEADNGGAIYQWNTTSVLQNSIVYGNSSSIDGGATPGNNHQLQVSFSYVEGSHDDSNGNIPDFGAPLFESPLDPGLQTGGDYRLSHTSLLINVGNNSLNAEPTDLDGMARINHGLIDLGAYENTAASFPLAVGDQGIIYVAPTSKGKGDGTAWRHATDDLQQAINTHGVQSVWVSRGTYKPVYRADDMSVRSEQDRTNAFVLRKDVKIFGGFAGSEKTLQERDLFLPANATVLSGDLGVAGDPTDNAFHVVISAGDVGSAELNGFVIADGNANREHITLLNGLNIRQRSGGGMYISASSPLIKNVQILSNHSIGNGAGIYMEHASPRFTNVKISGNSGPAGAGFMATQSSPVFVNALISGNHSFSVSGGGGEVFESTPTFINTTFASNQAQHGGALYYWDSDITIQNSIVYGNSSGLAGGYSHGQQGTVTTEYSFIQGRNSSDNGNIPATTDPLFILPLSPVPNDGGDYGLQDASPLINRGNNALNAEPADLDGNPRIHKGTIDLGAYENQALFLVPIPDAHGIVYVTEGGSGTMRGDSWANATNDFQKAVNAPAAQEVWVAKGTYHPVYHPVDMLFPDSLNSTRQNAFLLKKDVKIYGGFAGTETSLTQRDTINWQHRSVLSGKPAQGLYNVSGHVVIAAGDVGAAELNGFTITDARHDYGGTLIINGQTFTINTGGAVSLLNASPILRNLHVHNNAVFLRGGGLYLRSASPKIYHVVVENNSVMEGDGGGIFVEGDSRPEINNSIIKANQSVGFGGGLFVSGTSDVIVYNSLIAGNYAPFGGGVAIGSGTGHYKLVNVTIAGNRDRGDGGGIGFSGGHLEIHNSIIAGNSSGISDGPGVLTRSYSLVQGFDDNTHGNIPGTTDPLFENPMMPGVHMGGDYRLKLGSPGLGRGNNDLNRTELDLTGLPRIAGNDIDLGAYENHHPLPVHILNFTAIAQDGGVRLMWTTSFESNNKEFIILSSADGSNYKEVARVQAVQHAGTGNAYFYQDHQAQGPVIFYRLQQVDRDGRITEAGRQTVRLQMSSRVHVYPNPAAEFITVRFTPGVFQQIEISDAAGRIWHKHPIAGAEGQKQVDVRRLPKGMYNIRLSGIGNTTHSRFLKE